MSGQHRCHVRNAATVDLHVVLVTNFMKPMTRGMVFFDCVKPKSFHIGIYVLVQRGLINKILCFFSAGSVGFFKCLNSNHGIRFFASLINKLF